MKKYYISIQPFSDGHHIVHKHDCPFLLECNRHILLGEFASTDEAIFAGSKYFRKPSLCRFCFKEAKSKTQNSNFVKKSGTRFVTSRRLKPTVINIMFASNC